MASRTKEREGAGRFSVVHVLDDWYVACSSTELGRAPLQITLFDTPLVVYRDGAGLPAALLDRCAHRNVPLSRGRVTDGLIECSYHGWRRR